MTFYAVDIQARTNITMHVGQRYYTERQVKEMLANRVDRLKRTIRILRTRQRKLEHDANHDQLTGLANRTLLRDRFNCAVERAKRSCLSFAVLMIDLDKFKAVNDVYGHAAGDEVLIEVSKRIKAVLRTSDSSARLGGDEFVLIIEAVHDSCTVRGIMDKVSKKISEGICLKNGDIVNVGASIGFEMYPVDGATLDQMMAEADKRMYQCKKNSDSLEPRTQKYQQSAADTEEMQCVSA